MAAVGFTTRPHLRLMAVGAVAATAAWCAGLTPALSAGARDASVIVDLSVIDSAAGVQPLADAPAAGQLGQLLLPGSGQPVSRLYVPAESSMAPDAPAPGSPTPGYGTAAMPYGRLVVPPTRMIDAVGGRSVALRHPGSAALAGAPRALADAAAMPRPSSGSPSSVSLTSASGQFPPPQGFADDRSVATRGPAANRALAPAGFAGFPPPAPLAVAAREPAPSASAAKAPSLWAFSPARRPKKGSPAASGSLLAAVPTAKPDDAATLAAIEPARKARAGERFRLIYAANQIELSIPLRRELDPVVHDLRKKGDLRVQLAAYAGGGEDKSTSKARRTSLSRALAIRSHLIENGIKASRIDVRALGNKSGANAPERVDVEVIDK